MEREQVLFRLFGKYCPEGTILAAEGSPSRDLFVIQSGAVRVGAAQRGPGDLLGEESLCARAPCSHRAEVVQEARLIQVSDRTLDAFVRHGPQTARLIFERLLSLATSAGSELALWTIEQLLLRIAPNLKEAGDNGEIVPAELAERSGLVESDVLLVLEELRRRGCLIREGPRFHAPDVALLQREIDGFAAAGAGA